MYDLRIEGGNNDKWGNAPKLTKPTVKKNDFDFSAAVKKLANGDKAKGLADATADAVGKAPTSGAEVKGGADALADATADAVGKMPLKGIDINEAIKQEEGDTTVKIENNPGSKVLPDRISGDRAEALIRGEEAKPLENDPNSITLPEKRKTVDPKILIAAITGRSVESIDDAEVKKVMDGLRELRKKLVPTLDPSSSHTFFDNDTNSKTLDGVPELRQKPTKMISPDSDLGKKIATRMKQLDSRRETGPNMKYDENELDNYVPIYEESDYDRLGKYDPNHERKLIGYRPKTQEEMRGYRNY